MSREADFLVIGSGIAGFWFALHAAGHGSVLVVTKKDDRESNTNYAQGGIASVCSGDDSFQLHVDDTLLAGAGLCHRDAVELMVRSGPEAVRELVDIGVRFSREGPGSLDLRREGGHSRRRIVHAADLTGAEIEQALVTAARTHPDITVCENQLAADLILEDGGRCAGAWVQDRRTGEVEPYRARVTFLATGGAGKIYLYTSNPDVATGDGVAMAYRAGATVANLEFVQFHPTCLYDPEAKSFLISEAVRGEGAVLRALDGSTFMEAYHRDGALAPRDIVARAIDSELKKRGDKHVWLDLSPIGPPDAIRSRFPNIYRKCLRFGIDITHEPIPVVPAAHYLCGGVLTDLDGRTSLRGLYAAGEVACTGVHGANRLASNSLLEAVVFSGRAASVAVREAEARVPAGAPAEGSAFRRDRPRLEPVHLEHDWDSVRTLMWDYVGIVRTDETLKLAESRLMLIADQVEDYYGRFRVDPDLVELRNIVTVGLLIVRCARWRKESRGLHFNQDHPDRDDSRWARDTVLEGRSSA